MHDFAGVSCQNSTFLALGFMTGTSLDGHIDLALIETDGHRIFSFGPAGSGTYTPDILALLRAAVDAAREWNFTGEEPEIFKITQRAITQAQAEAALKFLQEKHISPSRVRIAGFHGQTVLHRPPLAGHSGATRQLGDGKLMANLLGIDTVFDFRSADIRAGGQGAPLAPVYHAALLKQAGLGSETAFLNLGGIGNITWISPENVIFAFDTGPANGPLNSWVRLYGNRDMDRDGALAKTGKLDEVRLAKLLSCPYFKLPFPKSLDSATFNLSALEQAKGLSLEDGATLLTVFVGETISKALDLLPQRPQQLILCGGGRRNPEMVSHIARCTGVQTDSAEKYGWDGDSIEAQCFAFLAVRRLLNLPISFPGTTSVPCPMTGGEIALCKPPTPSPGTER